MAINIYFAFGVCRVRRQSGHIKPLSDTIKCFDTENNYIVQILAHIYIWHLRNARLCIRA